MRVVQSVLQAIVALAYPVAAYFAVTRLEGRLAALALGGLILCAVALKLGQRKERSPGLWWLPAVLIALIGSSWWFNDPRLMLALPTLINLALLLSFGLTLPTETPMIERFARMQVADLSPAEVRYCRTVTWIWSSFFLLNGSLAGVLAASAPVSWWAAYTGGISYALIGLLGATEYCIRKYRFGRFAAHPLDRLLARLLGRQAEESP